MTTMNITKANPNDRPNDGYEHLLECIQASFDRFLEDPGIKLFTTDADGLFDTFLGGIPSEARQHYNCHACRRFIDRYGGIVMIDAKNELMPVMWWPDQVPAFFRDACKAVVDKVSKANVTGVFVTDKTFLGEPETGCWNHMAVRVSDRFRHVGHFKTAAQLAAEKNEEHKMLCRAIGKYSESTIARAVNMLRSDAMYRSARHLPAAEWMLRVKNGQKNARNRANFMWHEAAYALGGYCHISGGALGQLLEDIDQGVDTRGIIRRWNDMVDPVKYMRPQEAPSTGNVARAEEIVAQLGIANSLKRRYARLREVPMIWRPKDGQVVEGGVFDGIITKEGKKHKVGPDSMPVSVMTWVKFREKVLPLARKIEYKTKNVPDNYAAMTTAVDPDAPPLLKWDKEWARRPFSWYLYQYGSRKEDWCIHDNWVTVTGVGALPYGNGTIDGVFLYLAGCKDSKHDEAGLALFPESLRHELYEVRATIEAYSRQGKLEGYEEADACGIFIQEGSKHPYRLRVTTDTGVLDYEIDRWD